MAKDRLVTMQDVAAALGLSKASVSLALRNHPSIPKETQLRIARMARKMGYRPNPLVSALMSYHLRLKDSGPRLTLAFVTSHPAEDPWHGYSSYVRMFEGATKRATDLSCKLEEFSLTSAGMTPARIQSILQARGIRGVLAAPLPGDHTFFPLNIDDLVVVGLGMSIVAPAIMRVASDLYQLARTAVHHCIELGYRRIGFAISAEMSSRLEHRLLAGYRQGLLEHGLAEVVAPLMPPRTATFSTYLWAWCKREQPDVIIFGTFDDECQRAVPPEIGCVVTSVSSLRSPLTGLFQDEHLVGAIAVEQLLSLLYHNVTGALDEPRTYLLRGKWNIGRTAPGPGRKRRVFGRESS